MEGFKKKDNLILIVDGTNLIYRNYFVYSYRKTKAGISTGGLYGTIRSLKSYINNFNPQQIYIAFDKSEYTFRNKIYPDYKKGRIEVGPDLLKQFSMLEEYCGLVNIPFIEIDLYEADDIIGSLSSKAKRYNLHPYPVSGDRDLLQLIDKGIDLIYLSNQGPVIYNEEKFIREYNIQPSQYIEYKALVGDPSDNIPGIPGIGKKTAIQLLNRYRSIDGIYENIDRIKGKRKENILNNREELLSYKEILAIKYDLQLDYDKYFIKYIEEGFDLDKKLAREYLQGLEISF